MALILFSRSQEGLDCWKMDCLHPISWRKGWILTKLLHLYCCNMENNWLDFGDLDLIFKVTQGLRMMENGLSENYLMKEWMDFDQSCKAILVRHGKELIRFWWPWPHCQGHRRAQIVENWLSAPYLLNEWMDFDQTCTAILLSHGQDLNRFWWPWPIFKVTGVLRFWKMACLCPISWRNWWNLTKLTQLYCCDFDLIFKIIHGHTRSWHRYIVGTLTDLIRVTMTLPPLPTFQCHTRCRNVEKRLGTILPYM